jgi:hypothetical protein
MQVYKRINMKTYIITVSKFQKTISKAEVTDLDSYVHYCVHEGYVKDCFEADLEDPKISKAFAELHALYTFESATYIQRVLNALSKDGCIFSVDEQE